VSDKYNNLRLIMDLRKFVHHTTTAPEKSEMRVLYRLADMMQMDSGVILVSREHEEKPRNCFLEILSRVKARL
jgi:hypothetical protein